MSISYKEYSHLIKELSIVGFKIKDQRSLFGFLWSFLNPLLLSAVIFSLFKGFTHPTHTFDKGYFLFILTGIINWNFFAIATAAGATSLIKRPEMVKNFALPKEIWVLSEIGTFVIQHALEQATLLLIVLFLGASISFHALLIPVIVALELLLIIGISFFLSYIYAYARDLLHVWNALTLIAFFTVPIFYKTSDISTNLRWVILLNPMSHFVTFSRDLLLYHRLPSFWSLLYAGFCALFFALVGFAFFKKYEYSAAEVI